MRKIVIYSGFNRVMFEKTGTENGIHKALTAKWIEKRAIIWKEYTWKSILNQTYKKWVYCLCCHKDARNITDKYFGDITDKRFFLVYSDIPQEHRIMKTLSSGYTEMINVRIDSDDMYHQDAISELSEALNDESQDWFLWQNGYCYQYNNPNHRMKIYRPGHGSGPFYAKRYKTAKWMKQKTIAIRCQHQNVIKNNPKILSDNKILVGITESNTSTLFRNGCFRRKIIEPEKTTVLKGFGIV
ncbi:MAG TPA: hypothetical protein VMV77_09185 [Bacteroidales bacterium]|nr:hypothetical protein [Bacteroidales bacterium]